jgi:hypothetical protein
MESLTLSKAMELYEILGPHIPEVDEDEDLLEFVGKIIEHINSSNQHEDYTLSVELMSEKSWKEIKNLTSEEVLRLFIEGLIANKIIQLKSFCDTVGFSHA